MHTQKSKKNRGEPFFLMATTVIALVVASTPISVPAFAELQHNLKISSTEYKQKYGLWQTIELPKEFKINAIHAAALPTGKILLVAGSGNNRDDFNAYNNGDIKVLKTALLDPETLKIKLISTPSDLFCSGHALLQSGSLLIAGGTSGYELLKADVTKPAGTIIIHNESPDSAQRIFKKGTKFKNAGGKIYVSTQDATINPATKMDNGNGTNMIMHSSAQVFVEAVQADPSYVTTSNEHFNIEGLAGDDVHNIYGQGGPMTLDKQDFRGDNKSYEFDPIKEEYVRVGDLNESRWYASLPVMTNGDVLAVSGLDNSGIITKTTEKYSPQTKTWTWGPNRALPTYPALFRTQNPDILFFSGSSAGYGPENEGREPGFWNVKNNTFHAVSGLRDTKILETSGSVALPPAPGSNDGTQDTRIMLAGGGGVGESKLVTARTDIIDIAATNPVYTPGPQLPNPLRYINLTVTPWDDIFATGGTSDYRAKGNSYSHKAFSIHTDTNQITPLAEEPVGRTYHSGSLLLRDGRILVFGGDPLYSDKDNTTPGTFEQRLEIFTPPQYFTSEAPKLTGPDMLKAHRGQQLTFTTDSKDIQSARLIPPSTATHVTNTEQRSIGAIVHTIDGKVTIDLPADKNLMPNGWYMLFAVNSKGVPARAVMVDVVTE
jgi:hypothetical protein